MLLASVLNSTATVNDFDAIGSLQFVPGEQIKLVIRLKQSQRVDQLRLIAEDSSAKVTIFLRKKDGTDISKDMTAFVADRSIWFVELEESETEELAGGNITLDYDVLGDGTNIQKGWIENGMQLIITGAC